MFNVFLSIFRNGIFRCLKYLEWNEEKTFKAIKGLSESFHFVKDYLDLHQIVILYWKLMKQEQIKILVPLA